MRLRRSIEAEGNRLHVSSCERDTEIGPFPPRWGVVEKETAASAPCSAVSDDCVHEKEKVENDRKSGRWKWSGWKKEMIKKWDEHSELLLQPL